MNTSGGFEGNVITVQELIGRLRPVRTPVLDSEQRPWGAWHVIDVADGYKIKRIHVAPGRRLSLQTHEHRSEHWVVIQGVATCSIDDDVIVAHEGESVDVPQGSRHRLSNEAEIELVIVEVQLGHYTGEDDICRLEDDYGRCPMR